MNPIYSADQLAALIRNQIAPLRSRQVGARSPKGQPRQPGPAATRRNTDVAAIAAERIRTIAPEDPDRAEKAMRIFLECVLLAELGSQLVSDPSFGRMVDHVQQQLHADPDIAAASEQAAAVLLRTCEG